MPRPKARAAALSAAEPPPIPPPIPRPTAYLRIWWPVQITLPDGRVHRIAKVIAAREGLYVYIAVPADLAVAPPDWFAPIDFDKTAPPRTGYAATYKSTRITTAAGDVVIAPLPSCGCGDPLKFWKPPWAYRNEAWSRS